MLSERLPFYNRSAAIRIESQSVVLASDSKNTPLSETQQCSKNAETPERQIPDASIIAIRNRQHLRSTWIGSAAPHFSYWEQQQIEAVYAPADKLSTTNLKPQNTLSQESMSNVVEY